jgi:hypothetical protein
MNRADEFFIEEQRKPRLATGIKALDALIDHVRPGRFYLFYSINADLLDHVIHQILINGSLSTEHGDHDAKTLYFNTCNYHLGKTLLYPSRLATIAKQLGIDPKAATRNIYTIAAFNEMQQISAMNEVVDLVQRDPTIQLVIIHNITRFIETSTKPRAAQQTLEQIVGLLKRTAAAHDVALVVSCAAANSWKGRIPKPIGGTYLRHEAHVVILLDRVCATTPSIKITLVKHPYNATPQSLSLVLGRQKTSLTENSIPSVQQQLHKIIRELQMAREFTCMLRPKLHQAAFDQLIRDTWLHEDQALATTALPHVMDTMNLTANIHSQYWGETLRQRIDALEHVIKKQDNAYP